MASRSERLPLTPARFAGWLGSGAALLLVAIALGISLGAETLPIWKLLRSEAGLDVEQTILLHVRLPRVLLAALVGGALSVAGVSFQALLRNPLADPYVLGVSGGASLGGVIALALGFGGSRILQTLGVPGMAFLGALGALFLIGRIATVGGQLTTYTVLLTGAIFNAFSAALIYFIQSLSSADELQAIVFYLMGQIPSLALTRVAWIGIPLAMIVAVSATLGRSFNALSLGEESAQQLGVEIRSLKRSTFVLGALLTAIAVSVAGLIGFVGLIVPHSLRLLLGPDHRLLLPAAFFGGSAFLVVADVVARTLLAPVEIPVGVVTALVGAPFFLLLLRKRRDRAFRG